MGSRQLSGPLCPLPLVGINRAAPWIPDVIRHEGTGLLVWPEPGVIYGTKGEPVGAVCADGYVRLGGRRGAICLYAHRLIWEAVNGPIPAKLEINHVNGLKADNRIANLQLVTRAENIHHAIEIGLTRIGERHPFAKLTAEQVGEIRRTAGKISNAEWARRLGVDRTTIRYAREGKSWRHVPLRSRARKTGRRRSRR